jgi:hypothetical protein
MAGGGKIDNYQKNPLVLWMHRRPAVWKDDNNADDIFPIGLAYNLRMDNGKWLADIEFDNADPFAQKIEQKVAKDIIRMASPGIIPLTWSEDQKYLLPGQKSATLLEWELLEISIVDIGSQPTALKLYNKNREPISLNAGNNYDQIPQLKFNQNMDFLKEVAVKLGKEPDTAKEDILKALNEKISLAMQADELKTKYDALNQEINAIKENNIVNLVDANIDKKITADKRNFYIDLGKKNGIETLQSIIENLPELKGPSQLIKNSKISASENIKTFADIKSQGIEAVNLFKKENTDQYKKLFKAEYGFEPEM